MLCAPSSRFILACSSSSSSAGRPSASSRTTMMASSSSSSFAKSRSTTVTTTTKTRTTSLHASLNTKNTRIITNATRTHRRNVLQPPRATRDEGDDVPFGYTRLDVLLIGGGVTGLGFAAYYGLQEFAGFDAQWAGNVVQLTFVMLLTLLWVGSYIQRVFNKDMTYGKQLKEYEEAVMQKRLEEMPESELMALMEESEKAKNEK